MQIKSGKTHAGDANTPWNFFFFQQNCAVCRKKKFQVFFLYDVEKLKRLRKHETKKGAEKEFFFSTYAEIKQCICFD